jgi:DNA-binding transcriptional LysR family regulator
VLSAELKAFYMVARLGSITLAAKKLGLSQPTVTTQIRNLESQYSVELFYRGGRRLSVSDEGARLLPMVKTLLQQEADIEFFLRNSGQVQGTLRIAATAPYYILDLVKTFRERLAAGRSVGGNRQLAAGAGSAGGLPGGHRRVVAIA